MRAIINLTVDSSIVNDDDKRVQQVARSTGNGQDKNNLKGTSSTSTNFTFFCHVSDVTKKIDSFYWNSKKIRSGDRVTSTNK
jgi:hypothetical protein